jgi:hypothetical protein
LTPNRPVVCVILCGPSGVVALPGVWADPSGVCGAPGVRAPITGVVGPPGVRAMDVGAVDRGVWACPGVGTEN